MSVYISLSLINALLFKNGKGRTDAGRQGVIPGSPLACHALQGGGTMQSVSGLTSVCDAAPGEMTLVVDLEAELRHARVLTVG